MEVMATDTVITGMVIMVTDTVTTGMVIMATIITTDMAVGGTDAGTATASVLVGVGPRMATSGSVTNLPFAVGLPFSAPASVGVAESVAQVIRLPPFAA